MNAFTDFFTGDSPERRATRSARAGAGGGPSRDQGYDPNTGTTTYRHDRTGVEQQEVFARRNGVAGSMVPGQPDSWARNSSPGSIVSQQAARRHDQIKAGSKAENARARRNQEANARLLPTGSKLGQLPGQFHSPGGNPDGSGQDQAQLRKTPFGIEGINPRTGLPYSESPGKSSTEPKTPATPEGRTNQSTKTNALGVTQTGTNTGAINLPGLADVDMTGIANFNGPSFPTQSETNKITDGYSFTASEFLTDPKNADGSAFEAPGGTPAATNIAVNGNTFSPNTFAKGTAGDVGGLDGFKPGGKFAGAPTATDGLSGASSDTSGLKYDASKYKGNIGEDGPSPMDYAQSGEEMRRRSAFLDAPDSMEGMQRVAAGMGMGNQGLENFANVDGKAVAMSSADRRAVLNAAPGEAQALKDKWVQSLKTSNEDEPQTASSAQNPTKPSGTAAFNPDAKLDLPTQADAVDYMNNNSEDNFNIGNKVKMNNDSFGNTGYTSNNFDSGKFYLK